jgi:hypothetical protein
MSSFLLYMLIITLKTILKREKIIPWKIYISILILFIKTKELVKDICILTMRRKHNYYVHTINT